MRVTREQREAWETNTRGSGFNRWMRDRVNARDGTLDLQALWDLASEWGVDPDKYKHLNAGQQRMNIGNRLRLLVPAEVLQDRGTTPTTSKVVGVPVPLQSGAAPEQAVATERIPQVTIPREHTQRGRSIATDTKPIGSLAEQLSSRDLMRLYGEVIDTLRKRGVVRTGNAPLGDYAEHLFARAFGWRLENNSAVGHDAVDAAGLRFQIKTRRLRSNSSGERQLSVIRALPDAKFDMLAAVLFAKDFEVYRAALIPHAVVMQRAAYIAHVNGWRFNLDDSVWNEPGVRDVTESLSRALDEGEANQPAADVNVISGKQGFCKQIRAYVSRRMARRSS